MQNILNYRRAMFIGSNLVRYLLRLARTCDS